MMWLPSWTTNKTEENEKGCVKGTVPCQVYTLNNKN